MRPRQHLTAALILATLTLATLTLAGCSAGSGSSAPDSANSGNVSVQPAPIEGTVEGPVTKDSVKSQGAAGSATRADRSVVTSGYITVRVDKPMDAAAEAVRITEAVRGRVDARTEYAPRDGRQGSSTLILRIPEKELTATLDKLKAIGDVQEVSLSSSDITIVVQDLDARITAMRASVDRLLGLLSTATDTAALITLETAISDRQAQLESMESEKRYYADQVSMATITLNLVADFTRAAPKPDTFLSGLEAGWAGFLGFFSASLVVFGFLVPWLVLAAIVNLAVILIARRPGRRAVPAPSE